MAKYIIHAYPTRMWYVSDFLLPSLIAQGIDKDDIEVWNDEEGLGNLESFVRSCEYLYDQDPKGGTWHIQDDVIISARFKELTEVFDHGIVNGFCDAYFNGDLTRRTGITPVFETWFSFQCLRIPNQLAKDCAKWYREYVIPNGYNKDCFKDGNGDDALWHDFLVMNHLGMTCYNLTPCIVDHVDYLLGGSIVNPNEERKQRRTSYWEDPKLVEDLEKSLAAYRSSKNQKKAARVKKNDDHIAG